LLVIVPGRTSREAVHAVKELVQRSGVRLLGVIFNRLQNRRRAGYSGYSYYSYPYYYSSDYYSSRDPDVNGNKKGLWKTKSKKTS
jgi:Mrp family chromosome partitioning ATPase